MINSHKTFAKLLRENLKRKFRKIPSAAVLANEFNFRAYDSDTVSRETARKWLSGTSVPRPEKLRVLVKWLRLNIQEIYAPPNQDEVVIQDETIETIRNIYEDLSEESKNMLLNFANFLGTNEDAKKKK